MVEVDLSLAELLCVCRACAWIRLNGEPGEWFQPFLVARLLPRWPALAKRVAHFHEAELQTLARLVQAHQGFDGWIRQRIG
jgi:hypothetical protein